MSKGIPLSTIRRDTYGKLTLSLSTGFRIPDSPYLIESHKGKGGMGQVYKARNRDTGELIAVKVMCILDETKKFEQLRRFNLEYVCLKDLKHEHLVRVYEKSSFILDRDPRNLTLRKVGPGELPSEIPVHWIAMELYDKGDFEGQFHLLNYADKLDLLRQVCLALAYIHGHGIIHRDIKHKNILVSTRNKAALADFGIAKIETGDANITETGKVLATARYASPEQNLLPSRSLKVIGTSGIDHRTDIYSTGVLLYEVCTDNRHPYATPEDKDFFFDLHSQPAPPVHETRKISPMLSECVLRCLAKRPADRFQTATGLHDFLAACPEVELFEYPDERAPGVRGGMPRTALRAGSEVPGFRDHYEILRLIHSGPLYATYEVRALGTGEEHVLKSVVWKQYHDEVVWLRLREELNLQGNVAREPLSHVLPVLDVGELPGRPGEIGFAVLPKIEQNLTEYISGPHDRNSLMTALHSLLAAVASAVSSGKVPYHGNITGRNILVRRGADGAPVLLLTDFAPGRTRRFNDFRTWTPGGGGMTIEEEKEAIRRDGERGDVVAFGVILLAVAARNAGILDSLKGAGTESAGNPAAPLLVQDAEKLSVNPDFKKIMVNCLGDMPGSGYGTLAEVAADLGRLYADGRWNLARWRLPSARSLRDAVLPGARAPFVAVFVLAGLLSGMLLPLLFSPAVSRRPPQFDYIPPPTAVSLAFRPSGTDTPPGLESLFPPEAAEEYRRILGGSDPEHIGHIHPERLHAMASAVGRLADRYIADVRVVGPQEPIPISHGSGEASIPVEIRGIAADLPGEFALAARIDGSGDPIPLSNEDGGALRTLELEFPDGGRGATRRHDIEVHLEHDGEFILALGSVPVEFLPPLPPPAEPEETPTPAPPPSRTPRSTPTRTPEPSPTRTEKPSPTATASPSPTRTASPSPTKTPPPPTPIPRAEPLPRLTLIPSADGWEVASLPPGLRVSRWSAEFIRRGAVLTTLEGLTRPGFDRSDSRLAALTGGPCDVVLRGDAGEGGEILSFPLRIEIDRTPPELRITSPSSPVFLRPGENAAIEYSSADDASEVRVTLDGRPVGGSGTVTESWIAPDEGSVRIRTLVIDAEDSWGNRSEAATIGTVHLAESFVTDLAEATAAVSRLEDARPQARARAARLMRAAEISGGIRITERLAENLYASAAADSGADSGGGGRIGMRFSEAASELRSRAEAIDRILRDDELLLSLTDEIAEAARSGSLDPGRAENLIRLIENDWEGQALNIDLGIKAGHLISTFIEKDDRVLLAAPEFPVPPEPRESDGRISVRLTGGAGGKGTGLNSTVTSGPAPPRSEPGRSVSPEEWIGIDIPADGGSGTLWLRSTAKLELAGREFGIIYSEWVRAGVYELPEIPAAIPPTNPADQAVSPGLPPAEPPRESPRPPPASAPDPSPPRPAPEPPGRTSPPPRFDPSISAADAQRFARTLQAALPLKGRQYRNTDEMFAGYMALFDPPAVSVDSESRSGFLGAFTGRNGSAAVTAVNDRRRAYGFGSVRWVAAGQGANEHVFEIERRFDRGGPVLEYVLTLKRGADGEIRVVSDRKAK